MMILICIIHIKDLIPIIGAKFHTIPNKYNPSSNFLSLLSSSLFLFLSLSLSLSLFFLFFNFLKPKYIFCISIDGTLSILIQMTLILLIWNFYVAFLQRHFLFQSSSYLIFLQNIMQNVTTKLHYHILFPLECYQKN